jgi:hypothetical protein
MTAAFGLFKKKARPARHSLILPWSVHGVREHRNLARMPLAVFFQQTLYSCGVMFSIF